MLLTEPVLVLFTSRFILSSPVFHNVLFCPQRASRTLCHLQSPCLLSFLWAAAASQTFLLFDELGSLKVFQSSLLWSISQLRCVWRLSLDYTGTTGVGEQDCGMEAPLQSYRVDITYHHGVDLYHLAGAAGAGFSTAEFFPSPFHAVLSGKEPPSAAYTPGWVGPVA